MFKRIWIDWLDGWKKILILLGGTTSIRCLTVVWLPALWMLTLFIITMTLGTVLAGIRGVYAGALTMAGASAYFGLLIPLIGKYGSWWNRSGPDGRRPMHALWERFKRSRIANWWLEGIVRLIAWVMRHGVLAWTALSMSFVAYIVALDRASEAGLVTFMCSAPFFLVIGIPLVSRALSGFWERISKMPHLYSCG